MRILVCSLEAPLPPSNGFRLHLIPLLRELRTAHEVRVVALLYPDQLGQRSEDRGLRLFPRPSTTVGGKARDLPRSLLAGRPLGVDRLAATLRDAVREELRTFDPDVVHVTTSELALLADVIDRPSVIVPLDAWYRNAEARLSLAGGIRRALLQRQVRWVRRFESTQYRRFGAVVVVSDGDRRALLDLDPALRVHAIPNGVDIEHFAPQPGVRRDPHRIVFTGVMRYAPNVATAEFLARSVFPLVRAVRPVARLALVGRDPSARVQALAGRDGVEVIGSVPDMVPWLTGSAVFACPMVSGTGIKNKLLEAMACGLACVVTPLGLQGLRVEDGREVVVATTERELADALIRLLDDPALAERIGSSAREYVRAEHAWPAIAGRFEAVYREVMAQTAAR